GLQNGELRMVVQVNKIGVDQRNCIVGRHNSLLRLCTLKAFPDILGGCLEVDMFQSDELDFRIIASAEIVEISFRHIELFLCIGATTQQFEETTRGSLYVGSCIVGF